MIGVGAIEETLHALGNFIFRQNAITVAVKCHEALDGFVGFVGSGIALVR